MFLIHVTDAAVETVHIYVKWQQRFQVFVMGEVAVELFQETPTAFLSVRDTFCTLCSGTCDFTAGTRPLYTITRAL